MHALPNLITLQHSRVFFFALCIWGDGGLSRGNHLKSRFFFILTCFMFYSPVPGLGKKCLATLIVCTCYHWSSVKKYQFYTYMVNFKGSCSISDFTLKLWELFQSKKQILKANQIYCLTCCMVFGKSASIYILQDQKVKKLVVFVSNFNPKQFTLYPWK